MKTPSIDEVITKLTSIPKSLKEATDASGLPARAWPVRMVDGARLDSGRSRCPHPTVPDLDLFYVGISPSSAKSSQNLRKRVAGNHIKGNTGGSTFRLTLTSLLFETMAWQPVMTDRPALTRDDNRALTQWQHEHLRLTWAVHPEPWTIEHEVIEHLGPPLNLAGSTHEFGATLSAARRRFKEAAGATSETQATKLDATRTDARPTRGDAAMRSSQGRTQPVTAADKRSGQIRIPVAGTTKNLFPSDKTDLDLRFKDRDVSVAWDPRLGPDKERSGVVRFRGADKELLRDSVRDEQVLTVIRRGSGELEIS
jgi:hypothetical protein